MFITSVPMQKPVKGMRHIWLQKRDMFDGGSHLRDTVLRFLDDPRLPEVITSYVAKDEMEDGENLMTRRYLMCSLMFKNAQREGPVVNLRVKEQSSTRQKVETLCALTRYG